MRARSEETAEDDEVDGIVDEAIRLGLDFDEEEPDADGRIEGLTELSDEADVMTGASKASFRRFAPCSLACSLLPFFHSSFAAATASSSSLMSTKSESRPYRVLIPLSTSSFCFSTFFSSRKCLRTRRESVYGSEL